jgi:PAS domain S-box-containing protein
MDSKTIKVLLVEDNPVDVLLLREELSGLAGDNFIVSEVERLSEATQVLTTETFDVVLLDLGLPDSQGLDTFLELQKTTPDVPIVVMSGLDDESLAVEAVRKGAQDYLVKDKSDAFVLRRSIAYAIERQQLLVKLKSTEQSLRESEARFRAIFEAAHDSIYCKDRNLRFTHVNPAMARMFSCPPEDLVGLGSENLSEPETAQRLKEIDLRVLAGETVEEERMMTYRGTSYIFSTQKVPPP